MAEIDYEDIVSRITSIYKQCTESERIIFKSILEEVADKGYSQTLEQVWLRDFTEIPVSINQFITLSEYLGETNDNGNMVYPFWKETLQTIFTSSNSYYEILFSGATRIGKTSTAITGVAYMLYRLMIYRDPHKYFKKKSVSKFTLAFANLTKELAAGVGFREYNTTLKQSRWFNDRGVFTRSHENYYYIPNGERIEIIPASSSSHLLGKQLWCLKGNTNIVTCDGIKTLESLNGYQVNIPQLNTFTGKIETCQAYVTYTKCVSNIVRIIFEDGFILEGTPEHRILLSNNSYTQLRYLEEGSRVLAFSSDPISKEYEYAKIVSVESTFLDNPIRVYDVVNAGRHHNFLIFDAVSGRYIVSHNCVLMDEVNFTRAGVKDINKAKTAMKQMYDTANARITGTFKIGGEVYGKMFTCSSKNSDSDYLSDHIKTQLDAGNTSMYLVDEPQWKVLPPSMFGKETFYIATGDRYRRGFVIPDECNDEEHLQSYREEGYELLEVPRDFLHNFKADFGIALRDIAGISVIGSMGFITQESVTVNISKERENPFHFDIIVCGSNDSETLERNCHFDVIPKNLLKLPTYIHIDFAEVSDHIGICAAVQDGTKVIYDPTTEKKVVMPFYKQIFQIAVEAPRGDRMSYQKVVNFLLWLRRNGMNIYKVTTDQFQSSYVRETLKQQGFEVDKVSVDASEDPYIGLRNVLQDQRIELVKHQLQEDELVNLKRINGRIDHPPQSSSMSESSDNYSRSGPPGNGYGKGIGKDCADALAGCIWSLIQDNVTPSPSVKSMTSIVSKLNSGYGGPPKVPGVFGLTGQTSWHR